MLKKSMNIFYKDVKTGKRDFIIIYIILIPILMAAGILFFAPGITDSSVKVALLENDSKEHIEYMESYVKVELFENEKELERRVNKRDDIAGLVPLGEGYEIVVEGNEDEALLGHVKVLNSLYDLGITGQETTAEILSFEKTVPPLKTKLVNMLILIIIMLAGMIISLGIVEEKSDNTISAMNVTPVSQNSFILGKSLLGGFSAVTSIILSLLITGYYNINWFMIIIVVITSMILSLVIGFLQGINSSDVIEAAAGVKMMMLPIIAAIAVYELLADKWQWTMYWNPFYWSYRANDMILSNTAQWSSVLLSVVIVTGISLVIYLIAMPRIRKGLR